MVLMQMVIYNYYITSDSNVKDKANARSLASQSFVAYLVPMSHFTGKEAEAQRD